MRNEGATDRAHSNREPIRTHEVGLRRSLGTVTRLPVGHCPIKVFHEIFNICANRAQPAGSHKKRRRIRSRLNRASLCERARRLQNQMRLKWFAKVIDFAAQLIRFCCSFSKSHQGHNRPISRPSDSWSWVQHDKGLEEELTG
jgi:hypothetical protein